LTTELTESQTGNPATQLGVGARRSFSLLVYMKGHVGGGSGLWRLSGVM